MAIAGTGDVGLVTAICLTDKRHVPNVRVERY
jgi:hypothetical protein